jgi:hypothetical protein
MINKIKIGQTVSLSYAERKLAHFLAKHRNGNNRHFNVVNLKISAESAATVDLEGMCGEIGFCKLFNVYPDMDVDRMPPHPLHDCILSNGMRVDVKTTKYENGKLLVDARKGKKTDGVDLYALMVGSFPGPYTFRGFIAKEKLIKPEKIGLMCGYKSYMAEQWELTESAKSD